jgi:hypothetical protein
MFKIAMIHVSGVDARAVDVKPITRGLTGAVVEFHYADPLWEDLVKKVAFEGAVTVESICETDIVPLPVEVTSQKNVAVRVGITGVSQDGLTVIPTVWADLGTVWDSAYGDYPIPGAPMPPVWARILTMIGSLDELTTKEKSNLVAAINEAAASGSSFDEATLQSAIEDALAQAKASGEFKGDPGKDGQPGKDGYTPQKNVDYFDGKDGQPGPAGASGVHLGPDNPPVGANVWINPNGEPTGTEDWEFDLDDGTTDTRTVVVLNSDEATGRLAVLKFRQADGTWVDIPAIVGPRGHNGAAGASAYEVWLSSGNDGTESDFLNSIKGAPGDPGKDGYTPQKNVDYFDGKDGQPGKDGRDGTGVTILGSYDSVAELNTAHPTGGVGDSYIVGGDLYVWSETENTWKNVGKIQGPPGKDGYTPVKGVDYFDGQNGKDGSDGKDGYTPVKGVDYFDGESGVYVGSDEPPENATVWIDPSGEPNGSAEEWTFALEDGTTETKSVVIIG